MGQGPPIISYNRRFSAFIGFLFFFSGFCALVYEVTWVRKLSLIFGTDTAAIAAIIAIYFVGMALGSFLFRRARARPMLLYGVLEISVGIYAAFTPQIFGILSNYLFAILALGIPTILMGATFPVIIRASGGQKAGLLYGVNTLGATLGVLVSGFYLIGSIGVNETIWVAAFINICVGALALFLGRRRIQEQIPSTKISHISRRILIAAFCFGFAGMALEVLWTRVAVLVIGASTYAFSLVLIAFLLGIGIGSAAAGIVVRRISRFDFWTMMIAWVVGVAIVATFPFLDVMPSWFLDIYHNTGQSFTGFQVGMFFLLFLFMAIPTMGMGALFVLLVGWSDSEQMGLLYAANTIGGVLGSILIVYSLPIFGLVHSMLLIGVLYLFVSLCLSWSTRFISMGAISIILSLVMWNRVAEPTRLFAGVYADPDAFNLKQIAKQKILFTKDSTGAHVEVTKDPDGVLSLRINGKPDASTADDMENQILLGHIPLVLRPGSENALVIGLGSGITLGSVLTHPVESVDVVEIDEVVPQAAKFFNETNGRAMDDPRVTLHVADGRHFLAATKKSYDVITSEPSNPWLSGSSKLFTKEFFQLLNSRLKNDGVVIHWINMYAIDVFGLSSVIRAYLDVFPFVLGFGTPSSNDFLLVGSRKPFTQMTDVLQTALPETVKKDLLRVGINNPVEILGRFYLDRKALEDIVGDTPANTDNHPIVEFSAPYYLYTSVTVNPWRVVLDHMSPIPSGFATADKIRTLRILARIAFVEGDYASFTKIGTELLSLDPTNESVRSNLARIYFESGTESFLKDENVKAIEDLKRSLSYKETAATLVNLAQSYEGEGDRISAQTNYERSIVLDSSIELPYVRLGYMKLADGDLNSALSYFEKALQINVKNSDTHTKLGQLYMMRSEFDRTKQHLNEALRLDPKNKEAKELLTDL